MLVNGVNQFLTAVCTHGMMFMSGAHRTTALPPKRIQFKGSRQLGPTSISFGGFLASRIELKKAHHRLSFQAEPMAGSAHLGGSAS